MEENWLQLASEKTRLHLIDAGMETFQFFYTVLIWNPCLAAILVAERFTQARIQL
jgi:hypothetical protein